MRAPFNTSISRQLLLYCGVLTVIIYVVNVTITAALFPGYSHVSQMVSELGMANAPNSTAFNLAVITTGVLTVIYSIGLYLTINDLTNRRYPSLLTALPFALYGVGAVFAGSYPLPDVRHGGYGMSLPILVAPILFVWLFWGSEMFTYFKAINIAFLVFIILYMALLIGVSNFASGDYAGLFQRISTFIFFSWYVTTNILLLWLNSNKRVEFE